MGDAATPALPDFTSQTASVYKANIDAGFAVADRLAWAFAPHEQDVGSPQPDMTLRVDAGAIFDGTTLTEVAAQDTAVITAPSVDPRIDRVVIDRGTGAVSVITGTEAASPTPPAISADKLPICQVALVVSQTEIVNADLTDERVVAAAPGFPAATVMLFHQSAAPTGWTKDTAATLNNSALRIVTSTAWASGKQGATAFDSVFGSGKVTGAHTLASSEVPVTDVKLRSGSTGLTQVRGLNDSGILSIGGMGASSNSLITDNSNSDNWAEVVGGGGSHDHMLSLDLNYINMIIASKD